MNAGRNLITVLILWALLRWLVDAPSWGAVAVAALAYVVLWTGDRINAVVTGATLTVLARFEQQDQETHEQTVAEIASRQ